MEEIWKDIPWYEDLYQASNIWRINMLIDRGGKKKWIMKLQPLLHSTWYESRRIRLTDMYGIRKTYNISRLIASAFLWFSLNTPMKEAVIMHINNDATDNRVENLKIWTQSENTRQCIHDWRWKQFEMKWSKHNMAKLNEEQVLEIRKLSTEWQRNIDLSKIYWVSRTNICDILKRRIWTHI